MRAPSEPSQGGFVNIEEFAKNFGRMVEEGGKAMTAYFKPRADGRADHSQAGQINEVIRTLGQVAEYWLADPQRAIDLQTSIGRTYLDLWASAMRRMTGEPAQPVAEPDAKDRRFADPEWSSNLFFDFIKQAYLLGTDWAYRLVENTEGLDPHTRQKAEFYVV